MKREAELYRRAMKRWCTIPELEILGVNDPNANTDDEHTLAVFSFLIRNKETGYYLHYNYVTAVLNDLFGIQVKNSPYSGNFTIEKERNYDVLSVLRNG